jgi:hypothetical protein
MNEPRAQESQKLLGVAPSKYRPVKWEERGREGIHIKKK